LAIKRAGDSNRVFCFTGEMTSETGVAHECIKYSQQHDLPIHWIIEDNGKSVCTDTRQVWNTEILTYERDSHPRITYYKYQSRYPHAGAGTRVQF
jgi:TPP-dependent pyruvate/acetoin dehydrogenase alpha subunit